MDILTFIESIVTPKLTKVRWQYRPAVHTGVHEEHQVRQHVVKDHLQNANIESDVYATQFQLHEIIKTIEFRSVSYQKCRLKCSTVKI